MPSRKPSVSWLVALAFLLLACGQLYGAWANYQVAKLQWQAIADIRQRLTSLEKLHAQP